MKRNTLALALVAAALVASTAHAQATKSAAKTPPAAKTTTKPVAATKPKYKKHLPATLMKEAKITESAAAETAKNAVPGGVITEVALEKEGGKLVYSYDLKTAGKDGVDEVHVDAVTGTVVSNVHETAKMEKAEKAAESKDKKADAAKTKKPPTNTPAPVKKP